ncbi:helix-turn-helix transcriptional regulator [Sphingobacterium deserti]|uniref:Regulatory protein LuxR n=1 Tax=Sphingobacterium deserti TaxID=1229276 RepID=A0A0B8SYQ5_9SPHI|nr:hypothetical protein [Sphingobacterium deserti]KGE12522.1 regulatory protein LuxR [Sphingobacterium deserti]
MINLLTPKPCNLGIFRKLFILLLLFFSTTECLKAQSVIADSLRNYLSQPNLDAGSKSMALSHLSRATYATNLPAALTYAADALRLGIKSTDGQYAAFSLATLAYLNVQRDSLLLAQRNIDSALIYISTSKSPIVNGYVWLRKGWLEYIVNKTDRSTASLFKALQLLEGQHAYGYESLVYHYLASVYGDLKDNKKLKQYTKLSLESAYKAKDPDIICNAFLAIGSSFLKDFRLERSQKSLLDSSIFYNRKLLSLAQRQSGRIVNEVNMGAAALNLANIYWEFFPKSYKDSSDKYINLALSVGRKLGHEEIIANSYGILSEYAIAEGNYEKAEVLFLSGLAEVERDASSSLQVKALMMRGLASVAEKSGNPSKALGYYKRFMHYEDKAFDADRLAITQRLAVQYEVEKKDKELETLQERAAFNKKINLFAIGLVLVSLLALIFLFRSYRFRLKSSIQQEKLQAEESARLKAEQELLQERQERLQKELLAGNLQVEQKNELLQTMRNKLASEPETGMLKNQIERILKDDLRSDEGFEQVKANLTNIHPEFFNRLQHLANNKLSRLDLKHCSFILMGLSNKEIASRLGVDPKSILMARYRIKQKLNLEKEDSLDLVIQNLC